jgi:xanthine dehydrogenase YagS FAD-binding subunit
VKTFELTRANDNAQAIAAGAKSKTAQQSADIRFIAGGTTLIDLMKLNVEASARWCAIRTSRIIRWFKKITVFFPKRF